MQPTYPQRKSKLCPVVLFYFLFLVDPEDRETCVMSIYTQLLHKDATERLSLFKDHKIKWLLVLTAPGVQLCVAAFSTDSRI